MASLTPRHRCLSVLAAALALGVLAGCNIGPRNAGFAQEVLAGATTSGAGATVQVAPVTRETLATYARWPATGPARRPWIARAGVAMDPVIAPGDKLSITVWDIDESSLLAVPGQRSAQIEAGPVNAQGTIHLPFAGTVRVAGLTPDNARQAIEDKLRGLMATAEVQIAVTPGQRNTVNVIGRVGAPGSYPLTGGPVSLLSLLSRSGGVASDAANPQVELMRAGHVYGISAARLLTDPRLDVAVRGGDQIVVQEDQRYFLTLGAAQTVARQPFTRDNLSALEALSISGGVSGASANPKGVLILRRYRGNAVRPDGAGPGSSRVVFTIDLTSADGLFAARQFAVRSGDVIYATTSPLSSARSLLTLIASAFNVVVQGQRL